ncbi:MAG: GEVED domain-containing protein [Clostridium sp.]|nr:GEVED domain-containing protein [Clostridium sp.]
MWAMHSFVYADFDNNGFTVDDRVVNNLTDHNGGSFTVPSNLAFGDYRIRFAIDWNSKDPCYFADDQTTDNGEFYTDFILRVEEAPAVEEYALTYSRVASNYVLNVLLDGEDVESGSMVEAGTELTLRAQPVGDYKFVDFRANGEVIDGETTTDNLGRSVLTYTMPAEAVTITATFEEIPSATGPFTVAYQMFDTADPDEATYFFNIVDNEYSPVDPGTQVEAGTELILSVCPYEGYEETFQFVEFRANGVSIGGQADGEGSYIVNYTMPAEDVTFTVVTGNSSVVPTTSALYIDEFDSNIGQFIVQMGGATQADGAQIEAGSILTLNLLLTNSDYHFVAFRANGVDIEGVETISEGQAYRVNYAMPAEEVMLAAVVEKNAPEKYTVSYEQSDDDFTYALLVIEGDYEGEFSEVDPGTEVEVGTELTLLATQANEGYHFVEFRANGETLEGAGILDLTEDGLGLFNTVKYTMPAEDVTFTVLFEADAVEPVQSNKAVEVPIQNGRTSYRLEVPEDVILDRTNAEKVDSEWPLFDKSFTMMGWYKLKAYSGGTQSSTGNVLLGHQPRCHVNYNGAFLLKASSDGKLAMDGKNHQDGHSGNFTSDVVLPIEEWFNLAAVYDLPSKTIKVYYNGELAGTRTLTEVLVAFPDNPGVFTFGGNNANVWVDEAVIFDRALAEDEFETAMNWPAQLEPVAYYTFDEPTLNEDGSYANLGSAGEYNAALYLGSGQSSSDGGIISVSVPGGFSIQKANTTEGREIPKYIEPQDYCTYEGNSTEDYGRFTSKVTINDQEVAGLQTRGKDKIYWDKLETVLTFAPGTDMEVMFTHSSTQWIHGYVYIDYNKDGVFTVDLDENELPTAKSELVAFGNYSADNNSYWHNSNGKTYDNGMNSLGINDGALTFTLPSNLKPGDYRIRFKLDWNNLDACAETIWYQDGQIKDDIQKDGGVMIDATLRISLDTPREVSVAANDAALGIVAIIDPATEDTSVNVVGDVTVKATVNADDEAAYFANWTDAEGNIVSEEAEFTYTASDAIALTANFRQHYTLTVNDPENGTTVRSPMGVVESGSLVDKGTELTVKCTVSEKKLVSLLVNGEEVIENYSPVNGYVFTLEGPTVIEAEYDVPTYKLTVTANEGGQVYASAERDVNAPAGEIFNLEEATFAVDDVIYVVVEPAEGKKVQTVTVDDIQYYDANPDDLYIDAEYTTFNEETGIVMVETYILDYDMTVDVEFSDKETVALETIAVDELGDAEIYNLQGVRVARENVAAGIYIVRSANTARKVYINK